MYLNQIYFGEGAYGVQSAAHRFFGKRVQELSLAESAFLAGLPNNPSAYNPRRHFGRAKQRQAIVLQAMVEMEMITAADAADAKADTISIHAAEKADVGSYFAEHIRRELEDRYGATALYRDGLRVHTTLDLDLQAAAEAAVETNLQAMEERLGLTPKDSIGAAGAREAGRTDYLQAALICLDPNTGHIKAMVGGRDFMDSEWNRATQAPRQPGSAFKIFVYTAAIANGMTPADIVMDDPIVMEVPGDTLMWRPSNFSETFRGPVRLRYALAKSINIPAIKVADRIGQTTVIHYARRMGISSPLMPYRSLALGSFEVTLLELAAAVGVLPAKGIKTEPIAIERIESRDGLVLERRFPRKTEAISAQTAFIVTSMLEDVVEYGTAVSIKWRGLDRHLAGKTGTTNDYTDAWFVGFSPDLIAAVWVGFDEKRTIGDRETGARAALPIWVDFMSRALEAYPDRPFPEPHGIVRREICTDTGLLATGHCPESLTEVFITGTEPLRFCDLHRRDTPRPEERESPSDSGAETEYH
jgi:penicillin-binding protein 1A